jgi:hypothetical protein
MNPTPARQRRYIIESANAGMLDHNTKKAIVNIVMMEIGSSLLKNETSGDLSIDLDQIENIEVIQHIYNIVCNRREILNRPVHDGRSTL